MWRKPASLLVVPLGKALNGIPHLGVVDRWPATPKRARTALRRFLVIGGFEDKYANNDDDDTLTLTLFKKKLIGQYVTLCNILPLPKIWS